MLVKTTFTFAIDRGRRVDAAQQWSVEIGRDVGAEGREIAAHIGERVDPQREEFSVLVERQFGLGDVIAAVRVRDEALACGPPPI